MTDKRIRVVQVQVTIVTAVDDGDDLYMATQPQQATFPTLRAFQEFAAVHLPESIVKQTEALNAQPPEQISARQNRAARRESERRRVRVDDITPQNGVAPAAAPEHEQIAAS